MMAAPDQGVRSQIEAVKAHLLAEGLTDILEPPSSKEGYHSFRSMYDKRLRLLGISYQWLLDNPNPAEVVAYLRDKEITRRLITDTYSATIHDRGTVEAEFCMRAAIYARILLALLCHLALATSASAECAWVLWWRCESAEVEP